MRFNRLSKSAHRKVAAIVAELDRRTSRERKQKAATIYYRPTGKAES